MKFGFPQKNKVFELINKYFIYIALFFVVFIVGAGVNFFLYPMWSEIQGTTVVKVDEKRDQLLEAQEFLNQLEDLRNNYAEVDYNDIQRLAHVLPRELNEQKIYAQISDLAEQNNLTLSALTINASSVGTSALSQRREEIPAETATGSNEIGKVQEVEISITVSGINGYQQFKSLLESIEKEAPLLSLSSVIFPPKGSATSFTLNTYYLAEL